MRAYVLAIGTAVFLFGFGSAFLAGYQTHNMINNGHLLDREYYAHQILTVIGMMIASVGIGIATYGLVFENHENDAGKIPKSAIVIGAVISAFGFGTACWAGLSAQHMPMVHMNYEAEHETLGFWSIVGMAIGSLGMAITIYGLASHPETHAMKRPRT